MAFVCLVAPNAHAQSRVLIDTFGPGDTYTTNGNGVIGAAGFAPTVTGNQFTVTGPSVVLGSITLPMELSNVRGGANVFDLDVETSVPFGPFSNAPKPSGVVLESFEVVGQMLIYGQPGGAITVTSVTHPLLQSGVTYWVVASAPDPTTTASWMTASIPDTTPYGIAQRNPAGGVWGYGNGHDAFRVTALAAPEPSQYAALALGAFGLGTLALRARRRRPA